MSVCELIIDSFAGGGGASLGIEQGTGRAVDVAINHDAAAITMHAANHPRTRHVTEDVWKASPLSVTRGRPVGLLWASPDCFPAGTLILTAEGYMPIEDVKVGDLVLTHKGRWRAVTETMQSAKFVNSIRGHGHYGLHVSGEHPFWVRSRKDQWNNKLRRSERTFSDPKWVKADALGKSHYWATPTRFGRLPAPAVGGRGLPLDTRLCWLIGRYLADGWTRITKTRAELVIVCGKSEVDEMSPLDAWPRKGKRAAPAELAWHKRATATEFQFSTNHRGLVEWLRCHFGHLAHDKRLPGWVYGLDEELRATILSGYLGGDGWDQGKFVEARTVSKALAFSLKSLAASLGYAPTIYQVRNSEVIEGRKVKTRLIYMLRWRHRLDDKRTQTIADDTHLFAPIREATRMVNHTVVYNIGVAEDESYVAEGVVVHNCKHFSRAKGSKPVNKTIRSLAWVVVKWAVEAKPRVIILENVREFADWGPVVPRWECRCGWKGTESQAVLARTRRRCPSCNSPKLSVDYRVLVPDPKRKGLTFKRFVGRVRNLGYAVEWRNLNAADYGAPTHRRRLFLIARNDGKRIVWPEPTHGDPKKLGTVGLFTDDRKPWRTAAECIDWSLPCPSIFDRKQPLAEKTMRRIALGIRRYVLDNPRPFIVHLAHGEGKDGRWGKGSQSGDEPLSTIHAGGNNHAVVTPYVVQVSPGVSDERTRGVNKPLHTVVGKTVNGLITPLLVGAGGPVYAGKPRPADAPMGTLLAENRTALVSAFIVKHFGGVVGAPADSPLPTTTMRGTQNQAVTARLVQVKSDTLGDGEDARNRNGVSPCSTRHPSDRFGRNDLEGLQGDQLRPDCADRATASGNETGGLSRRQSGVSEATLLSECSCCGVGVFQRPTAGQGNGDQSQGWQQTQQSSEQLGTGDTKRKRDARLSDGAQLCPSQTCARCGGRVPATSGHGHDLPSDCQSTRNRTDDCIPPHAAAVYGLLIRYFGTAIGQHLTEPLFTITGKDRFGLVTVTIDGEPFIIADIGMRMLSPRELANAQGFPSSYVLTGPRSHQVARIGNSVAPVMAKVLAAANFKPLRRKAVAR